jgi:hypothetical protein
LIKVEDTKIQKNRHLANVTIGVELWHFAFMVLLPMRFWRKSGLM